MSAFAQAARAMPMPLDADGTPSLRFRISATAVAAVNGVLQDHRPLRRRS